MATVALGLINPLKYLSIMLSLPQVAQCFAIMIGNSVHYFYKWYLNFKYGKKKKKKVKKKKGETWHQDIPCLLAVLILNQSS